MDNNIYMESNDAFLASVDIPAINPPPDWTGFTISNLESWPGGNVHLIDAFTHPRGVPDPLYKVSAVIHHGDLCVGGFNNAIDKEAALRFLREIKEEHPQLEIVFKKRPKSPGVRELIREGIGTAWREICKL